MTSSHAAVSETVRLTQPSIAMPPTISVRSGASDTRPRLGFRPTSPQQEAGILIEPPPSLACAIGTMPAAVAEALPPEEPPGVRDVSHGLRQGPWRSGSETGRIPNSGRFVLPTTIAPAARRRRTGAVWWSGTQSAIEADPKVVRTPSVTATRSLI